MMKTHMIKGAALCALLLLAACEDAEERAARYYQSGLTLLEAGDTQRALVEFRNVFEHDGFHKEARQIYADTLYAEGQINEAYGQYLRLIEQYPDTLSARLTLAEIALARNDWREVTRHGPMTLTLDPENLRARAIGAAIAYHDALNAEDDDAAQSAAATAKAVLTELPENIPALRVVIDADSGGPLPQTALPLIERALAVDPTSFEFHTAKLRLLTKMQDDPAAIAQLEAMFARFPDNPDVRTTLVNWYLTQENYDAAETILRKLAGDPAENAAGYLTVVQFLRQAESDDAALAELDQLIAQTTDTPPNDLYRAMAAMIAFEQNPEGPALADMQALTQTLPDSDQSRRIQMMHAQMLVNSGDINGARTIVRDVLTRDRSNVAALKMRAGWQIADDRPDAAIADLRAALSQSPRDPEIMLLMATAHQRTGFPELAGERLALAVEVSGAAAEPALRYARFLIADGRTQAAASLLNEARRVAPGNLELVSVLADLYLAEKDWPRATAILRELRVIPDNPRAAQVATALEAAILAGQDRTDESLAVLQDQLAGLDEDGRASLTIALAQIRAGKIAEARTYLNTATSKRPDDMTLRMLSGSVAMMDGDADSAEGIFRDVLDQQPTSESAVRLLYSLLHLQGRDAEKAQVLQAGLSTNPTSETLLWIQAGALEQQGDIDGAIAIYEQLYAADTTNVIIANNLASLIATHKTEAADLERAFRIARRLRGMDVPAFQDTYGWIAYRRGDYADALDYLKPAAENLPGDPLVQYHLGMTYYALGKRADAKDALTQALEIAADSPLPQFAIARETLQDLIGAAQ